MTVVAVAGEPQVILRATVADDLTITGTLELHRTGRAHLVDPLASLPDPVDDLQAQRTWPGAPSRGVVRFEPLGDGRWRFFAVLPHRYGDTGHTRRGLFANGYWYPQLVDASGIPVVDWDVEVELPAGALGAVGDSWGRRLIRWTGHAERASLAVVPRGRMTFLDLGRDDGRRAWLITRGKPRAVLVRELEGQLATLPPDLPPNLGIVEAPLRRRLVRAGPGLAYVSDRAWRVTPGTRRFHRAAVTRGLLEALSGLADPGLRDLVGAALGSRHALDLAGADASRVLRWGAWLPRVDAMLHDQTMPFAAEVLEHTLPGDPVRDDLVEVFDPHVPGDAVAAWIADVHGHDALDALAATLLAGASPAEASEAAEVDRKLLEGIRTPWPPQDYHLEVQAEPPQVAIRREAEDAAPPEVVVVRVDGTDLPLTMPRGPTERIVPLDATPRRVSLDPEHHVAQASRLGDSWPTRWTLTMAAGLYAIDLTEGYVVAEGAMWLRRRHDTRNTLWGSLYTGQSTLAGVQLGYTRKAGPLLDGLRRSHRLSGWVSPGVLSARYADVDLGRISLGGGLSWSWDTRVHLRFPLRGHRTVLMSDAGWVPGSGQQWWAVRASASGVTSPGHPRHAVAGRVGAAVAGGGVEHALLDLGGGAALASQPDGEVIGTRRAVAAAEYRWAPIRHASVPAIPWVLWATELQLALGVEAAVVWMEGEWVPAAGATVGIGAAGDWLGYEPEMMAIRLGFPLWAGHPSAADDPLRPQLLLTWGQAF